MPAHLYACRAVELSDKLDDVHLFVLMAVEGIRKGGEAVRTFRERDLDKPSVTGPLSDGGASLRRVLRNLCNSGFIDSRGRRKYECTTDGNLVKHEFNDLYDDLLLQRCPDPLATEAIAWLPTLRDEMRRRCAEEAWKQDERVRR